MLRKEPNMPSINRYIMTIARCSNQFRSERLRDTGLCGQHCAYILRVCREPGTTQDAIAREIYVNKSNVTRQLAALEQNGFVERRPCETDSRAMGVGWGDWREGSNPSFSAKVPILLDN